MMNNVNLPNEPPTGWKNQAYLVGATAGLFFGLLSAYMYTRSAEDDQSDQKLGHRITSGEMLGLGLAGLAMMRQVAELGKGKEDKSKKRK
jgi:hypothetical protein